MDPDVLGPIAIVVTMLVAIAVLVCQGIVQSNKYDYVTQRLDGMFQHFVLKFDAQSRQTAEMGQRLEEQIDAQGKELNAKIDAQGRELNAKIDAQGQRLEEKIDSLGHRLSESEREQARLEGVNSVLRQQSHSHRPVVDD